MHASIIFIALVTATTVIAAEPEPEPDCVVMSNACLAPILMRFDPELTGVPGSWQLTINDRQVLVITDAEADRMRIMSSIAPSGGLTREQLHRLMQANFESALDARYSIAHGAVWATYIHPLYQTSSEEVVSALAQTVTLAQSYGTSFSSGLFSFGGGDNAGKAFRDLQEKGTLL